MFLVRLCGWTPFPVNGILTLVHTVSVKDECCTAREIETTWCGEFAE